MSPSALGSSHGQGMYTEALPVIPTYTRRYAECTWTPLTSILFACAFKHPCPLPKARS